jgi:hypothetical protein
MVGNADMTEIFTDGFESGDFSAWTGIQGNPVVQNTIKRTGQYAASSTIDASHRSNYAYKSHAAQTSVYMRFYLYFAVLPPSGSEVEVARLNFTSSRPFLTVYNDGSVLHWRMRDGGGTLKEYTSGPSASTWYCVELKGVVGDECALYVNGSKILTGTAPSGSSNSAYLMGWTYYGNADGTIVYFDDVVVSDSYIGCMITSVQVSDALSLADNILRNKPSMVIADNVSAADSTLNDKFLQALDSIGVDDTAIISKLLAISDNISIVEVVERRIGGALKTRLFLILGDLAIQFDGS